MNNSIFMVGGEASRLGLTVSRCVGVKVILDEVKEVLPVGRKEVGVLA